MTDKTPRNRPKRTPVGRRNVLRAEARPGFVRRFVNNNPERVQQLIDAGYVVVKDGSAIDDPNVGTATSMGSQSSKPVGGGKKAILMEIKEEWYREDQQAKQQYVAEKEQGLLNDENGRVPDQKNITGEGISIQSNKRPVIKSQ